MSKELNGEWTLLAKYLVNDVNPEEKLKVESLLKENESLRKDFQKLVAAYYLKEDAGQTENTDAVQAFNRLKSRIKKD